MKANADAPIVYTLLLNSAANGAGGYFNAGNSRGLYVAVWSASTSTASVALQQSFDKVTWFTVYTVTNPAVAGTIVLLPPAPYTRALVSGYSAGNITAKVAGIDAPVTTAGLLAAATVSFGAGSFTSVTDSGLTATRVPFASTGGLLADDSTLTFDSTAKTLGAQILKGGKQSTIAAKATDGAIASAPGTIAITKGSALGSSTLATPTVTAHDGYILRLFSTTAFAHVISCASGKINGGTTTTVTFTSAAVGDGIVLEAYQGVWYVLSTRGTITLS